MVCGIPEFKRKSPFSHKQAREQVLVLEAKVHDTGAYQASGNKGEENLTSFMVLGA